MEEVISLTTLATVLLTLTLFQTPALILTLTKPYSKLVSKPILKKKLLTKCHSEVSENAGIIKRLKQKPSTTTTVLNGLKNDPSDEFIGEVILKINVV
jgi:hypothetical protein